MKRRANILYYANIDNEVVELLDFRGLLRMVRGKGGKKISKRQVWNLLKAESAPKAVKDGIYSFWVLNEVKQWRPYDDDNHKDRKPPAKPSRPNHRGGARKAQTEGCGA